MAHTPGRSILPPFTRRGPPTEDEERKGLEERRAKSRERRARELPPARSIPRTPHDPSAPTINPPGGRDRKPHPSINPPRGAPGPRNQEELTAADEARRSARDQQRGLDEQNRLDRNKRLRERGLPEEELPSERRFRGEAIRRDRVRREAQRRDELGLDPREDRGASIKAETARIAALSGDLSPIPRVRGSLDDLASKARANPSLLEPNEIVRTTVDGQETLQRFNAQSGTFTPMRIDPVTGNFVVDLTTPESLSDADLAEAVGDIRSNITGLLKDATPDETKDLNSLLSLLDAAEEFPFTPAQFANFAVGLTDRVNRITKEKPPKVPAIKDSVDENVMPVKGFDGWWWVRNAKTGALDLKQAKVGPEEEGPPIPATLQEFLTEGDTKQQLANFSTLEKQARSELDAEAKVALDAKKAEFATKAKIAFDKKVAAAGKKEVDAIKAAGPELFAGPESPPLLKPEDVEQRVNEIFKRFLDARGPAPTTETSSAQTTPPTEARLESQKQLRALSLPPGEAPPAIPATTPASAADTGFKGSNIAAAAKELGMSEEAARARLRNLVPP